MREPTLGGRVPSATSSHLQDSGQRSGARRFSFIFLITALVVATSSLVGIGPAAADLSESVFDEPIYSAATVEPAEAEPGVSDSIVRLYLAVFDREPDPDGLDYWVERYMAGTPLDEVGAWFISSAEWQTTYGDVDDTAFVGLLYQNVLDRQPDPGGQAFWLDQLATSASRTDLLLGFSESVEFVAATATASPMAPPAPPPSYPDLPADSGVGRRVVYSNSEQRVWWVDENELVVNSYPVSGRRNTPSPGTYSVFSKSEKAWAGHDGITMNHMVRFARGTRLAIGFHSIPRYSNGRPMQTEAELGSYRSAGCVRQRDDTAEALFNWAEVGTTVVVTR